MRPSLFTRIWCWMHRRLSDQQEKRTAEALRCAEVIAAGKKIGQAILDGHAAAKVDAAGQARAKFLRLKVWTLDGMKCAYGLN